MHAYARMHACTDNINNLYKTIFQCNKRYLAKAIQTRNHTRAPYIPVNERYQCDYHEFFPLLSLSPISFASLQFLDTVKRYPSLRSIEIYIQSHASICKLKRQHFVHLACVQFKDSHQPPHE